MTEEEKLKAAFDAGVQAERERVIRLIEQHLCKLDAEFSDGFSELLQLMERLKKETAHPVENSEL